MKKTFLTAIIIAALSANAQEGIKVGFRAGYGLPAATINTGSNQNNNTETVVNSSLNQGLNLGLNLGYNLSKYIGLDLGINYLMGGAIKNSSSYTSGGFTSYRTSETKANFLFIQPSLTLSPGFDKLNPYVSFGPSIGFGSLKETAYQTSGTNTSNTEIEASGGIPIGFRSALGACYKLSNKLFLNFELFNVNMSYAPTKAEITKATSNGQDVLGSMSVSQKKVEFVESFDRSASSSANEPSKRLKQYYPLSSFGVNLGISFFLGGSASSIPVE
jgi:opacity protein-like surface antigen